MMVKSATIARIKARVDMFLTETCLIEAQSQASDEYGNPIPGSRVTVASNVSCRIIDLGERLQSQAVIDSDQETIVDTYRLILPAGTAIAKDQIITISGDEYDVVDLITERTDETDVQAVITRKT